MSPESLKSYHEQNPSLEQQLSPLQEKLREVEGELNSIRSVCSRRPALDKPTLRENVEHAIFTAGQKTDECFALQHEVKTLRSKLSTAEQRLEGLSVKYEAACNTISRMQNERQHRDSYAVLSSLSSFLGQGFGDASTSADDYDKRIRAGIEEHIQVQAQSRAQQAEQALEKVRAALEKLDQIYRAEQDEPGIRPDWLREALSSTPIEGRTDWDRLEIDLSDPEVKWIHGLMCFQCGPIAHVLARNGHEIPRKAEHEQSYVIGWLLKRYIEMGKPSGWREQIDAELNEMEKKRRASLPSTDNQGEVSPGLHASSGHECSFCGGTGNEAPGLSCYRCNGSGWIRNQGEVS